MSTDLGGIDKLIKALEKKSVTENVYKKAALATHAMTVKRIFPARGQSANANNKKLGRYTKEYRKTRQEKKNWGNAGVILQYTGKLHSSWAVREVNGKWTSGFIIPGRLNSKLKNEELAEILDKNYGMIFEATKEEDEYFTDLVERYMEQHLK